MNARSWVFTLIVLLTLTGHAAQDSLPPLKDGKAPANLAELWGDYDPRKEPLETQVVREWTEGGITLRHVIFTIGIFKGKPAKLAAFYGFVKGAGPVPSNSHYGQLEGGSPQPTGEKSGQYGGRGRPPSKKGGQNENSCRVPGILHVHGGGQSASLDSVRDMARNGYACLSINWGGNKMEGAKEGDPNTDWGAVDATQRHNDHYGSLAPDPKTLDSVESPRNNNWFLLVLAARRSLTFLEQQPEVDPDKLGVTGHSMGGKITTDVAGIDKRVKAAAPSCGGAGRARGKLSGMPGSGLSDERPEVYYATIDDNAYIPQITCPILFLSPANDFAGPFDNMTENWKKIGSKEVAYTVAPHLNHHGIPESAICGILWFDQYLKGGFNFPQTPKLTVTLKTVNGVPRATVKPDRLSEVVKVDIFYSVDPHCLTRFWRDAEAKRNGDTWDAELPVMSTDQPLYVYANVSYTLKTESLGFRGAKAPDSFLISSKEAILLPEELGAAGVKATDRPTRLIDDFSRGWQDWYRLEWNNPHHWVATTRKLKDSKWRGPDGAKLVFEVRCPKDNVLKVTVVSNGWGAFPGKPRSETFTACRPLKGSSEWQIISLSVEDMIPAKKNNSSKLTSWDTVTELSFSWSPTCLQDGQEVKFGSANMQQNGWREPREFRNLHWEGGTEAAQAVAPAPRPVSRPDAKPAELDATIQEEIKKSLEH